MSGKKRTQRVRERERGGLGGRQTDRQSQTDGHREREKEGAEFNSDKTRHKDIYENSIVGLYTLHEP